MTDISVNLKPPAESYTVLQAPDPRLLAACRKVTAFDSMLVDLCNYLETTRTLHKGVGLAAPQIGVLSRVVSVNPMTVGYRFMINPEIIAHGKNKTVDDEGCLSIGSGKRMYRVARYDTITVRFQLTSADVKEVLVRGMGARIVQHELDHLDGKLINRFR